MNGSDIRLEWGVDINLVFVFVVIIVIIIIGVVIVDVKRRWTWTSPRGDGIRRRSPFHAHHVLSGSNGSTRVGRERRKTRGKVNAAKGES